MCYEGGVNSTVSRSLKVILILTIMSTTTYGFILTRWGSNSKYALLGGFRSVAQTVSYEVCLALFVISLVLLIKTLGTTEIKIIQSELWVALLIIPTFLA